MEAKWSKDVYGEMDSQTDSQQSQFIIFY